MPSRSPGPPTSRPQRGSPPPPRPSGTRSRARWAWRDGLVLQRLRDAVARRMLLGPRRHARRVAGLPHAMDRARRIQLRRHPGGMPGVSPPRNGCDVMAANESPPRSESEKHTSARAQRDDARGGVADHHEGVPRSSSVPGTLAAHRQPCSPCGRRSRGVGAMSSGAEGGGA